MSRELRWPARALMFLVRAALGSWVKYPIGVAQGMAHCAAACQPCTKSEDRVQRLAPARASLYIYSDKIL